MPYTILTDSFWQSGFGSSETSVRLSWEESYDSSANRTLVTLTGVELISSVNFGSVAIHGRVEANGTVLASFGPGVGASNQANVSASEYRSVSLAPGQSLGGVYVPHDSRGEASVTFRLLEAEEAGASGMQGFFGFAYGGSRFGVRASSSGAVKTAALTRRAMPSTVSSYSAAAETLESFTLSVERSSPQHRHKVSFKKGTAVLAVSPVFEGSLSYTLPRSFFASESSSDSMLLTVSLQTYTDASCSEPVGEPTELGLTLTADAGMRPQLSSGWAAARAVNTGAAAGMSGFIKGRSKAEIVFDTDRIANAVGASTASFSIRCGSASVSASPYLTPVLAAAGEQRIVCTVTDSRGRSASEEISVTVMDHAPPVLSGLSARRCTSNGTPDEGGTYCLAAAGASCSPLNGQNACTLSAALRPSGGSWGQETAMTNGSALLSGLAADRSYTVRITATDSLGAQTRFLLSVPTRTWAMKFRPDGRGVAFGKAAERDRALDLPEDWTLCVGGSPALSTVDGWTAEKRPDGVAECWKTLDLASLDSRGQLNGWYWTSMQISLPAGLFTSVLSGQLSAYWGTGMAWGEVRSLNPYSAELLVFSNQDSGRAVLRIHVQGKWK